MNAGDYNLFKIDPRNPNTGGVQWLFDEVGFASSSNLTNWDGIDSKLPSEKAFKSGDVKLVSITSQRQAFRRSSGYSFRATVSEGPVRYQVYLHFGLQEASCSCWENLASKGLRCKHIWHVIRFLWAKSRQVTQDITDMLFESEP
jgi:hypothetical protein